MQNQWAAVVVAAVSSTAQGADGVRPGQGALSARGIPTVEPLAWGVRNGSFAGESFLITRELQGAVPLQSLLLRFAEHQEAGRRRQVADYLGRFLAQLHEAGVTHPDLHPGNILAVEDERGLPRFHLIDLHSIRMGGPLTWARSRDNLVIFNRWFSIRSSRADRQRFWRSYLITRKWDAIAARERARDLDCRSSQSNIRFWHGRDQRCLGNNRYFRRVRSSEASGFAVMEMDRTELKRLLDDPDYPFANGACRLLKDSRTSTVAEIVLATPDGPRTMIWKRFRVKKALTPLLNRLRSSPVRCDRGNRATRCSIATCRRPGRGWCFHRRGAIGPGEGYLLCEKVENALEPKDALVDCTVQSKRESIAQLARLLRQFHDSGLSHRDLKAANVLWSKPDAKLFGQTGEFQLIDLVGVRRHKQFRDKQRARDLSRLNVSFLDDSRIARTDQLRFLRSYMRWALSGRANWKRWWRQIATTSEQKVARNQRTGRPVT